MVRSKKCNEVQCSANGIWGRARNICARYTNLVAGVICRGVDVVSRDAAWLGRASRDGAGGDRRLEVRTCGLTSDLDTSRSYEGCRKHEGPHRRWPCTAPADRSRKLLLLLLSSVWSVVVCCYFCTGCNAEYFVVVKVSRKFLQFTVECIMDIMPAAGAFPSCEQLRHLCNLSRFCWSDTVTVAF